MTSTQFPPEKQQPENSHNATKASPCHVEAKVNLASDAVACPVTTDRSAKHVPPHAEDAVNTETWTLR